MNEITQPSITDWITAVSAFGSLIILAFYTYYTYKMQKSISEQVGVQTRQTEELVHQRRLAILPSLIIKIEQYQVFITNIGNGVALNVELKSVVNNKVLDSDSKELLFKFNKILKILPQETVEISGNNISATDRSILLSEIWDNFGKEHNNIIIGKIYFQDIEGTLYEEDLQNCFKEELRYSFPQLKI